MADLNLKRRTGIPTSQYRPILRSNVFLYCVKRSLHKSRLINWFIRARWSQSHTHNGFFKLVEALPQIYSCFFSHTIELYVVYCYQQCNCLCLAALPAKMSVFNCHMQVSHSVIQINPDWTPKKLYLYIENPESLCYEHRSTRQGAVGAAAPRLKNLRVNSVFRASASCSKILNDKNILIQWKISGQLCFLRQEQVAKKSWMIKSMFNTVKSFVHICISKGNYHKISSAGEHNTQQTSSPWVKKQGNYRICL